MGWYYFEKLSRELKVLLALLSLALVISLLLTPIGRIWGNNLFLFHFYTLIEYSLLAFLFSYWQTRKSVSRVMRISILVFTLIWVLFKFSIEGFSSMNNYSQSLANLLLSGMASYTLLSLLSEKVDSIYSEPKFWVSSAVLIYHAGNLFLYAFPAGIAIWSIHNLINIISNVFYVGGFLCLRPR